MPRIEPFRLILAALTHVAPDLKPRVQKRLIRAGYQLLSRVSREGGGTFMNYGYAPLGTTEVSTALSAVDAADRFPAALYERVGEAVDPYGKDILEVGSGRGGGAEFLTRRFGPRSMIGIDFAERAVAFSRTHHRVAGLSFAVGDAEHLPFAADSFDAVVSVESSHCYPSMDGFLGEVARVLRAGGHLLLADLRLRTHVGVLRERLVRSGLRLLLEERITRNVFRALELDSDRRLATVPGCLPDLLRGPYHRFLGVQGTEVYDGLRTGELEYLRYVLQKPMGVDDEADEAAAACHGPAPDA